MTEPLMTFIWPSMLLSLVLVPLIILFYLRIQRRQRLLRAGFARFGSPQAARRSPGLRRHVPPALFITALSILLIALARPQAAVSLPRVEGTIILVFDVSGSMAAEDADPTRMEAAKALARDFVQDQPETVQIGIVSFSSSGFAVQTPTNDTEEILTTIDRLEPQAGTSLGQGILVALNTIAIDAGKESAESAALEGAAAPQEGNPQEGAEEQGPIPVDADLLAHLPEGPFPSSMIVILSDGENNMSLDPLEAAQAAADREVRVDTIGFGSTAGITLDLNGFSVHTALNEPTLQQIAQVAGGQYHHAQNEQDPQEIYKNITPQLVIKPETIEITSILAGASMLVLMLGGVVSLFWFGRLV
jgi:Ca-activated chloride channel family protein